MPQLWTETIVTQYFWLVVILVGFYFIAVVKFIPQIAFTLKARRALETAGVETKKAISSPQGLNKEASSSLLNNTQTLLSTILTPQLATGAKTDSADALRSSISAARSNWINKFIA